jgi:uncharacterized protein with PIN domain
MPVVTGFHCVDEAGLRVLCDAHGNNVALRCLSCGGPVLATILPNQRGSDAQHLTECPACHSQFWVEDDQAAGRLTVHRTR